MRKSIGCYIVGFLKEGNPVEHVAPAHGSRQATIKKISEYTVKEDFQPDRVGAQVAKIRDEIRHRGSLTNDLQA